MKQKGWFNYSFIMIDEPFGTTCVLVCMCCLCMTAVLGLGMTRVRDFGLWLKTVAPDLRIGPAFYEATTLVDLRDAVNQWIFLHERVINGVGLYESAVATLPPTVRAHKHAHTTLTWKLCTGRGLVVLYCQPNDEHRPTNE